MWQSFDFSPLHFTSPKLFLLQNLHKMPVETGLLVKTIGCQHQEIWFFEVEFSPYSLRSPIQTELDENILMCYGLSSRKFKKNGTISKAWDQILFIFCRQVRLIVLYIIWPLARVYDPYIFYGKQFWDTQSVQKPSSYVLWCSTHSSLLNLVFHFIHVKLKNDKANLLHLKCTRKSRTTKEF